MIIIFLDIDGVLLKTIDEDDETPSSPPADNSESTRVNSFDPQALQLLDHFIAAQQAKGKEVGIVISSTYREGKSAPQLKELFKQHAFAKYIIDKTVDTLHLVDPELKLDRAEEIDLWLQVNRAKYQVDNYVVFDDNDNYRGMSELFKDNFIHCRKGVLVANDTVQAAKSLDKKHELQPVNPNKFKLKFDGRQTENNLRLTSASQKALDAAKAKDLKKMSAAAPLPAVADIISATTFAPPVIPNPLPGNNKTLSTSAAPNKVVLAN